MVPSFPSALLLVAGFAASLSRTCAAAESTLPQSSDNELYIMTDQQMDAWLATTDAVLTSLNDLTPPSGPQFGSRIIWCDRLVSGGCGGSCTIYNGNQPCVPTHQKTQCMAATRANVAYCTGNRCDGWCGELERCRYRLGDGFCWTGGVGSVQQGFSDGA